MTCALCGAEVPPSRAICEDTIACNTRRASDGSLWSIASEKGDDDDLDEKVAGMLGRPCGTFPSGGVADAADDLPPQRELEIDFALDSVIQDTGEGLLQAVLVTPKAAKWKNVKQTFVTYRDISVFWSGWLAHPDKAGARFGYWLAPEPNGHWGSMISVVGDEHVRETGRPIKPLPVGTSSEDAGRLRAEARIRLEGALDHAIAVGEKLGVR